MKILIDEQNVYKYKFMSILVYIKLRNKRF